MLVVGDVMDNLKCLLGVSGIRLMRQLPIVESPVLQEFTVSTSLAVSMKLTVTGTLRYLGDVFLISRPYGRMEVDQVRQIIWSRIGDYSKVISTSPYVMSVAERRESPVFPGTVVSQDLHVSQTSTSFPKWWRTPNTRWRKVGRLYTTDGTLTKTESIEVKLNSNTLADIFGATHTCFQLSDMVDVYVNDVYAGSADRLILV